MNNTTATASLVKYCRACHAGGRSFCVVLEMDPMPLAGVFCSTRAKALAAPVYPLTWVRCGQCGLVQVHEDVADAALYESYHYASSTVPGLVRHFAAFAEDLTSRYASVPGLRFLEIGCNDGVLISRLPAGWTLVGVDPSDIARNAANETKRYRLINRPFSSDLVKEYELGESFDVVLGSNCLAHMSDIYGVLHGIHSALKPGGEFWMEVHDLSCLLEGSQWDTIYHEHKVEWDAYSIAKCLGDVGFTAFRLYHKDLHGGLLRIVCRKGHKRSPCGPPACVDHDLGLARLRKAYRERYETPAATAIASALARGETVAAFGASGRANVYLNQTWQLPVEYVVDESSARIGRFLPRIGTEIVARRIMNERPPQTCLITAWNYGSDIIERNSEFGGRWVTAFGPLSETGV